MNERQKIIVLSSILWLFLAAPWLFLYWNEAHWINSKHLDLSWNLEGPFLKISKAKDSICQYFIAPEDDLARIDLMLSEGKGVYRFELFRDAGRFEILQSFSFENEAQNYDFMSFAFEPIVDSAGGEFAFCLSSNLEDQSASGVFLARQDYQGHGLSVGNELYEGKNLVYQVYSYDKSLSFREFLDILFRRMSQYKPGILKISYLYGVWALFYVVLFGVIYQLIRGWRGK